MTEVLEMDILDKLEAETGYVKLYLTSGDVVYGYPLVVIWTGEKEDVKEISFDPYLNTDDSISFYTLEEIEKYEVFTKEEMQLIYGD